MLSWNRIIHAFYTLTCIDDIFWSFLAPEICLVQLFCGIFYPHLNITAKIILIDFDKLEVKKLPSTALVGQLRQDWE